MNKTVLTLLISALFLAPEVSYGKEDLKTLGDQKCEEWLAARKEGRELSWQYEFWVVGNLTGLNHMWSLSRKPDDPSHNPLSSLASPKDAYRFVDMYCVRKRAENIGSAVTELFYALAIHKAETTLKGQQK
jgi:hypothetical protein